MEFKNKLVILNGLTLLCEQEGITAKDVMGDIDSMEYLGLLASVDVNDSEFVKTIVETTTSLMHEMYVEMKELNKVVVR